MVHNGIGYGVMAAYAEGLNILRNANIGKRDRQHLPEHDAETTPLRDPELYQFDMNLPEIAEVWRRGSVIGCWLLDLTASALLEDPGLTQDGGRVSDSGEGRWTIQASIDEGDLSLLQMSAFLIDDPFADRLYPSALAVIERLETFRTTVILSDGDVVFQPRKVVRSGLWDAVSGRVLIYIHKQQMQGAVQRHHPARHDVMVDDKLRILAAIKQVMEDRLTTVFPRQGHYALDPAVIAAYPPADFSIERIGDLLDADTRSLCAPPGEMMNHEMNINTRKLHDLGQRIWLDNITREKLNNGKLARYIAELSVTGLTSNPTTFEHAIGSGNLYDAEIQKLVAEVLPSEDIFFELALQDLTQAADLFRPTFDASSGGDGGVSLEVSPLLANDSAGTIQAAARLHARAARPKLFIKIPGTPEGLPAIEQSIFNGVPINVTLLFSRQHYVAAAQAYLRGIERRLKAGLDSRIESVASLFVSRWDAVVKEDVQPQLHSCLGIAIAMRTYMAHCGLLASERWQRLAAAGARPQRLLWASTGAKDPASPDTLYVEAHVAAQPIDTIPEKTLLAFADHGKLGATLLADGGDAESVLNEFKRDGVDDKALAARLQQEGVQAFAKSWSALMARIREKSLQPAAKAERAGTA